MCLISSLYEARQQKKAAREAQQRAAAASLAASAQAQSEKNATAAEQVKEATPVDAAGAAPISAAKKSQGVQSTQLNKNLG